MSETALPTGFAPAAPDDAPQGFRVLGAGDGLGTGDALQSQALAVQDPARAGRALALSEQTGIPRDAALRQTDALDRRLRLAKATRALREAHALRARSLATRDLALLDDAETLRAEIPASALADAFADPVAGAAILEDLDGWLALRAEMARSPGSAQQNFDAGLELGRRSVRMGELAFRRASGDPAVAAEWQALKAEVEIPSAPLRAPAYLTPEQAAAYGTMVDHLAVRDRDGKLTFVSARRQPEGLALAPRDTAQQVPILASLGTGAAIGAGLGAGVPLAVGTGVTAVTGNPAGVALGAAAARVTGAAGARIGAGVKAYPLNFGESLAALEETTYARPLGEGAVMTAEMPLPHEAVVAASHLAAAVKTGLDLVGVEALIELIGARTVFSGATRGLRARLTTHLAKNPAAVGALVGMGRYLVSIGAETATEDLQTRVDFAAQAGAAAMQQGEPVLPAAGAAATSEAAGEAAGEARRAAATSTAVLGPFLGAGGALVRRAARIPRDRAEREKFAAILAESAQLKLRETAPASFRAFAQRLGEESGVETTYMSPDELLELFQDDAEGFRGLPEQVQREIEAALEQGRDAKVPIGATLSVLAARGDARSAASSAPAEKPAAGGVAPGSAPRARLTPTQLTEEEEQELLGDLAAPDDALAAPRAPLVPPAAEAHFKRIRAEIVAAANSPHDRRTADAVATLVRQATLTRAARRGISVEEAIAEQPLLRFQGRQGSGIAPAHPALLGAPVRDVQGEERLAALKRAVADLREGKAFEPKSKLPVLTLLKAHGGVDPTSTLGGELRNLGITNQTLPGIFRRKGGKAKEGRAQPGTAAIDTLNKDEHPELFAGLPVQKGTNYLEPNAVLDAIRRELAGEPILSPEDAGTRTALEEQRAMLTDALAEANLDLAQVDDETAAQALYAMEKQGLADELFQGPITEGGVEYALADADRRDDAQVAEGGPDAGVSVEVYDEKAAPAAKVLPRAPRVALVQTGTFRTALTRVTSAEDVAHLVAELRKDPQEQFLAVITGARGKVLRIVRTSRGTMSGALVHPMTSLSPAFQVEGAARVWVVHNHPSGEPSPSLEDREITTRLRKVLKGSGVELAGSLVVAPGGKAAEILEIDPGVFSPGTREFKIPAKRRDRVAGVFERRFRAIGDSDTPKVSDAHSAMRAWRKHVPSGAAGLLLLNTRHRVVGWLDLEPDEMQKLRTGDHERGVGAILREAGVRNASSMIAFMPTLRRVASENLAAFGRATGVDLLDALNGEGVSAREQKWLGAGETFFQPAYHGSWVKKLEGEKFSMAKIGTGEGAKAGRERLGLDRPSGDEQGSLFARGGRGSITFSPDQREAIVRFSAAADLSTALHEIGHYYTLTLLREADALREQEPGAAWEQQVLADADALLKAVGAEPGDTVTREQAEQLTDSFLAYLRTGKAPSEALRSAFGRFREWLVALYRSVRDLIGKEALPDDVRAVFDRLLATDEEIARQEGDAALGSIFAPGEVTPEEQATLEAAMAKARERVTNQVDRAQLLAMAKQRGIFERVEAERDRKEAEVRESIAAEVARDMAREPVWQADHYLRTGELLGRVTPPDLPKVKLARKALYSLFREDTPAGQAIKEVPTGQRSWLTASKAGVHPDTVAEQFGFASGADLVRALLAAGSKEAGSRERVAAEEVKRRLAAAGRLAAGELEERVLAALAGDSMADWLETQDKVLHAQIGDGPTPLQALRHQAERMLSETRVGDVLANRAAHDRSTLHRATAEREQRAARKAYKAGDRERAALHLQRVQLHRILERLSYAAKDEIRGALDLARRYRSSAEVRKRIGLSGDGRLDQIDGVLERVVLKAESDPETRRRRAPFIDWVRARMADGDQLAVPDLPGDPADPLYAEMPRWMREGMRVSYREMTLGEFRGMLATLKSIDHAARRELAVKIGEETRQREDVRRSLIAEVLSGTLRPATRLSTFNLVAFRWRNVLRALSEQDAARLGDRMFASARKADALATGKEALIWSIAGADPTTTIYQLFVGKLSAAEGQHGDRLRGMIEPLEKSHSRYLDKRGRDYLDETLPENRLQNRWKRAPFEVTRRNLLHVAYNVGNVGPGSNLTKLLGGYGWLDGRMVDDDPDGARAWIVGILDEHLDAEDWAHVQAVWDLLESFRDEVLGFEERMTGHAPEPITPAPFVTPRSAVKMRGGYFPVVYDPARSDAAALRQAEDILRTEAIGVGRIEPRHPYTKARTFLRSRALLIEGDEILFNHLESVSRDLAFREALLDIWKTINHEDVHQTMREVLGDEFSVVGWWKPWLQSIAGEQRTPSGLAPFQRAAYGLHHRAAAFTLLGRLTTILKQATGVANAVQQLSTQVTDDMLPAGVTAHVGLRHLVATRALIQATWRSFGAGNPAELLRVRREAMAKFPVLRGRLESYDREIKEVRNRVRGQTGGKAVLIEGAAKAIAWVQLHSVDIPLALAAYDLAKGRGLGESAAIASAETAVRVGEGSGSRLSQPVILTTFDGLASVFFGFLATYRFTSLNQVRAAWRTTHSPGAVLGALIFSAWVPSALGGAIALLWWGLSGQGGEPPEDEDWWQTISRNGLEGVADLIPGMTDLRRSIEREQVQVPGSAGVLYRELVAAGVDTVEAVQGEEDAFVKALFDAARLWALRHGLPGDYPLRTIEDVAADDEPSGSRRGSSRGGRGR